MNKKKTWTILALLLLFATAVVWALWTGEDPQLTTVRELGAQARADGASEEQRRQMWGQMREEMEKLSPESRDVLRDEWRQKREARENERMKEFFAMTRAQQIAQINKEIDDRERRRQQRAQSGQNGSQGGGRNGQGQGGGGGGPNGQYGGGPGGRGGGRAMDPVQRRKDYLDKTTPDQRAERSEYRRMVSEQRSSRGLK
jgi:uncharacterized membrane protein YgcG